MTSSPGFRPRPTNARCRAAVPLQVATACFTSQNPAKAFSNSLMKRPFDEIQLLDRHSKTYSISRPSRTGAATGIRGWTKGLFLAAEPGNVFIDAHASMAS
jgi:hypothetical protein